MIELYTKPTCQYCTWAKEALNTNARDFIEIQIGTDITRDEVIAKFPDQKVVPIVVVDGVCLGSYAELLDYLFPAKKVFDDE